MPPYAIMKLIRLYCCWSFFYLYMKTIQMARMPNKLWERVKLPCNYEKTHETIGNNLMYWFKFLVYKAKQRLTKMTQMRTHMRKCALKIREEVRSAYISPFPDLTNSHATMTTPRKEKKRES
ncbi:hypothetical protein R6Q59_031826 [Mikania micrantha]